MEKKFSEFQQTNNPAGLMGVGVQNGDNVKFPPGVFTPNNATASQAGLMTPQQYTKLEGVESGAQTNKIETIQVNGTAVPITGKTVNIPVSGDGGAVSQPTGYEGQRISVLGDSISTYSGYMPTNPSRPSAQYPSGDVTSVSQTYWMGAINKIGGTFGVNEAYGGSRVTNGHATYTPATDQTRINNLGNNGAPDHIVVFVGINDFINDVPIGTYNGRGTMPIANSVNLGTFREAYAIMINRIQIAYPMAQVWVCTFPGLNVAGGSGFPEVRPDGITIADWCNAVSEIGTAMGCRIVAMSQCGMTTLNTANFTKDGIHPNLAGHTLLRDQLAGQMLSRSTIASELADLSIVNNSIYTMQTSISNLLLRVTALEQGQPIDPPVDSQLISALPVGSIVADPSWTYNGEPVKWIVASKNHHTKDSGYPVNAVTLISQNVVTFKAIDAKEPGNPTSARASSGNGRYSFSNIDSWLNSDAAAWFTAKHTYDASPIAANVSANAYAAESGFMTNISSKFKSLILPTNITVLLNDVDGGGSEVLSRQLFLPSFPEITQTVTVQGTEGYVLEYFDDAATITARRVFYPTDGALAANDYATPPAAGASVPWFLRSFGNLTSNYRTILATGAGSGGTSAGVSAFSGATTGTIIMTNVRSDSLVNLTPTDGVFFF